MPNPLFDQMVNPQLNQFIQQIKDFKSSFSGNPREEVENLLKSGQMSQSQFNQYSQIARQISKLMGN